MIRGLHHVAVSTPDIDRITRFYVDVLGFEKIDWPGGWERGNPVIDRIVGLEDSSARQVMLRAGNLFIEVFQYLTPEPRPGDPNRPVADHGYTHFCLDVTDLEAEYVRLTAAGMRFHCPPVFDREQGIAATYGRDPDGNVIEIQEILKPDHVFHASRSRQEGSGGSPLPQPSSPRKRGSMVRPD
jgi:catechol 2,3-dioxygenase-like lactoylglutathione lyase family enzyme